MIWCRLRGGCPWSECLGSPLCEIYLACANRAACNWTGARVSAVGFGAAQCGVALLQGKDFIAVLKSEHWKSTFGGSSLRCRSVRDPEPLKPSKVQQDPVVMELQESRGLNNENHVADDLAFQLDSLMTIKSAFCVVFVYKSSSKMCLSSFSGKSSLAEMVKRTLVWH